MSDLKIIAEPGTPSITITRSFSAPRDLVFKAYTDPAAIPEWWGPAKYATKVEKLEPRTGGLWRFVSSDSDGNEFAFNGVFHTVTPSDLIIQTFEFEGMPGHVQLETMTFEERDGRTHINSRSVFQSVEDRDGMAAAGMENGVREGYERLDVLLSANAGTH